MITGSETVDSAFLRYIVDVPEGEPFDARTLEDARRRLLKLDTFRVMCPAKADTIGLKQRSQSGNIDLLRPPVNKLES